MDIVVGSGPAGIACAKGLLAAGRQVTILDSGLKLEKERTDSLHQLETLSPPEWTDNRTSFLRDGIASSKSGIPLKLAYGSDFPYRIPEGATSVSCRGVDTKSSYACGGFSTVWGSAVLPYLQEDIADWPIGVQDLKKGYEAVLEWMPLSARSDDLANFFPLYTTRSMPLASSRQALAFGERMTRNRERLHASGVYWGSSRIAVSEQHPVSNASCATCGLCMYGCPLSLIYSSDRTLDEMIENRDVVYHSGFTVHSVSESGLGVDVHGIDPKGNSRTFRGTRVFVAAGHLNTTSILLRSLNRYGIEVKMKDSQYFLLPILQFRGTPNVSSERLHTLAQIFVEIFDSQISPHTIHLQTYTYNDLFRAPLSKALGPLRSLFPVDAMLGRLLLFQGYLHSSHSSAISATLKSGRDRDTLELTSVPNPDTKRLIHQLSRKLTRLSRLTGVLPLTPMAQIGLPGRGFHSGGAFPMSNVWTDRTCDTLGRPCGMQRVHAVDATVFPSIPATTITLTVMANAYRIAREASSQFPDESR